MIFQKVKKSEINTDHFCKICNKFYASASICNHNKKFHEYVSPTITIIDTNNNNNNTNNPNTIKCIKCKYCNKIFNHRSSKSRHEKLYHNNDNKNIINNNITNNNNNITNNNTTNNINNINNTNNIIIKLNNFGNEDLSHLTQKDIINMIEQGFCCVFDYIDKVHLNPNKPENNNIMLTNLRSGLIKIFKDYGWKVAKCNNILDTIINKCYDLTLNNYNNLKNNKKFYCKAYENWLMALDTNTNKTYNDKYQEMKLKFYNK